MVQGIGSNTDFASSRIFVHTQIAIENVAVSLTFLLGDSFNNRINGMIKIVALSALIRIQGHTSINAVLNVTQRHASAVRSSVISVM